MSEAGTEKTSPIKVTIEPCSPIDSDSTDLGVLNEHKNRKTRPLLHKSYTINKTNYANFDPEKPAKLSGPLGAAYSSYLNRLVCNIYLYY